MAALWDDWIGGIVDRRLAVTAAPHASKGLEVKGNAQTPIRTRRASSFVDAVVWMADDHRIPNANTGNPE